MAAAGFLAGESAIDTRDLRETLALMQHHDAVTGTSPPRTVLDYQDRIGTAVSSYSEQIEVLVRAMATKRMGLDAGNITLCSFPFV